jgi:hypothetical protein
MGFLSWIAKLLFGKKEETKPAGKTAHEKIRDKFFIKIQGELLRLRKRLGSIRKEEQVKEARRELEKLRGEFTHIDRKQQKYLSGVFKQCEAGIISLEKRFKQLSKKAA